ncbi:MULTISPECIES: hypothetical protein [unclassified Enterobacter cloacae complex]|uniref:hypothetical protein n=1 Tax=unclassified Enterobacter cloacae complex TaxID=2757714 RepID=UPI0018759457|nr:MULTISPECIES: hypothetical protein [unclassified Enterobacter cloacae complex]MBE4946302.1 hypothetical protein [Enterobacter cloacae complex sp. P1B]MBE4971469.1 hypothetical protein [Enterobacter cloacae complex sp. P11RS]
MQQPTTTVEESQRARRVTTMQALLWRYRGDRERMRMYLNLSRLEVLNQRYFLGGCPF